MKRASRAPRSVFRAAITPGGLWKACSCLASSDGLLTLRVSTSPSSMRTSTINMCKAAVGVVLVAGDFNKVAHRDQQSGPSPLKASFRHALVPWPTGGVTLHWGPGAEADAALWPDCCGFVKVPRTRDQWCIKRHGSFQLDPEAMGLNKSDHSWHYERCPHLQFANHSFDRAKRPASPRKYSAVAIESAQEIESRAALFLLLTAAFQAVQLALSVSTPKRASDLA